MNKYLTVGNVLSAIGIFFVLSVWFLTVLGLLTGNELDEKGVFLVAMITIIGSMFAIYCQQLNYR